MWCVCVGRRVSVCADSVGGMTMTRSPNETKWLEASPR